MLELLGYGARIVPDHPVQLGRLAPEMAPAADTAILAEPDGGGDKLLIVPGETSRSGGFEFKMLQEANMQGWVLQQADDGTRVVLGDSRELADLAEVSGGPADRQWRLASDKGYVGRWPEGYNVLSTGPETSWPFEMVGHDGSMLYVRGPMPPERVPDAQALAVGDQRLVRDETGRPDALVELAYDHGGEEWRLSYHFVEIGDQATVAVCCQASADGAQSAQANAGDFGKSLRARQK